MMGACGPIADVRGLRPVPQAEAVDRAMNADQTTTTGLCEARMRICSNAFVQSTAPAHSGLHGRPFVGGASPPTHRQK